MFPNSKKGFKKNIEYGKEKRNVRIGNRKSPLC